MASRFWTVIFLLVPLGLGGCGMGVYPGSPYGYGYGYGNGYSQPYGQQAYGYSGYGGIYSQSVPSCPVYGGTYPQSVQPYYQPFGYDPGVVAVVPPATSPVDPVTQPPHHSGQPGVMNPHHPGRPHHPQVSPNGPGPHQARPPQNFSPGRHQVVRPRTGPTPQLPQPGKVAPRTFSQRQTPGPAVRSRMTSPQAGAALGMAR